jgi:hypothetical protein
MLRVPAILVDMIPQLMFLARYYYPITEEASRDKIKNVIPIIKAVAPMLQSMGALTAGGKENG